MRLAENAHLIAVDPPGFGGSERSEELFRPPAGRCAGYRHIVDIVCGSGEPGRFRSLVIGSCGTAVPITVTGVLKDWVEATDLEPYRQFGGRKIVEIALSTIAGYTPSDEIREDYMVCVEVPATSAGRKSRTSTHRWSPHGGRRAPASCVRLRRGTRRRECLPASGFPGRQGEPPGPARESTSSEWRRPSRSPLAVET
jgi:hypothetical protein